MIVIRACTIFRREENVFNWLHLKTKHVFENVGGIAQSLPAGCWNWAKKKQLSCVCLKFAIIFRP